MRFQSDSLMIGTLVGLLATGCSGCREEAGLPVVTPPSGPPQIHLSLSGSETLSVSPPKGDDESYTVYDGQSRLWVFFRSWSPGTISYMIRGTDGWSEPKTIGGGRWSYVDAMTVLLDAKGRPLIIVAGFDDRTGAFVAAIHRKNERWSDPVQIDRLDAGSHISNLAAVTDTNGMIHLVYARGLVPPESYGIGFPMVEGASANKIHHVTFDGERWSTPQATTGRARFSVHQLALSARTDNQVLVSATVRPFTWMEHRPDYIGYQLLRKGRWSSLTKLTPPAPEADGFATMDGWGHVHAWSWGELGHWHYHWPASATADGPEPSVNGDNEYYPSPPVIKAMDEGKLAALVDERVLVWNGATWSAPQALPSNGKPWSGLAAGPDGKLVAWQWHGPRLLVQDIAVVQK